MIFPSQVEYKTETLYDTFSKTITGILDTVDFQREYVWPEEEPEKPRLAPFVQDFMEFANIIRDGLRGEKSNSLGQVVFLHDITTNSFKIIDGLQRLTTLCLFIEAAFSLYNKELSKLPEDIQIQFRDDILSDFADFNNTIANKFNISWKTKSKEKGTNYNLGYTEILKVQTLNDWFNPTLNTSMSLNRKMRLILNAIQYSKLSYVYTQDENTSINMFEQLNSGVPLEPFEFFKVKLKFSKSFNTKIPEFNSLFIDEDNNVNEDFLANCLNILPKVSTKDTIYSGHIIPSKLKSIFLDPNFNTLVLNSTFKEGSFYDHCVSLNNHIEKINEYFNTKYSIDGCFTTKPVNKLICLAYKAQDFENKKEEYYKLFLLAEVLITLPKPGPMAGTMWNDLLIILRKILQENKPLTISSFYSGIKNMYYNSGLGWMRDSLVSSQGNERFLSQRYNTKQAKKLKRIFLLIETALNKNNFPLVAAGRQLQIEHIDAKTGSNKIGNLLLLESNINQSVKDIDWKQKNTKINPKQQWCYSDSIFWMPKMMFGKYPEEITNPNFYLKPETKQFLASCNMQNVSILSRESGSEHNLGMLLDYAIQRIIGI